MGYLWDLGIGDPEGFYYMKSGTPNSVQSVLLICPDSDYGQVLIMNNVSEEAMRDWGNLYGQMEDDLIEYPKLNLVTYLRKDFLTNTPSAVEKYRSLVKEKENYFTNVNLLNRLGYELMGDNQLKKAIAIFELNIEQYPESWNVYDSLGEAFEKNGNLENALTNYKKALALNVNNQFDYNKTLKERIEKME